MRRLLIWWNARAAIGGWGFALLRFTIALAVPLVLVLVLAILAQATISGH